MIETMIKINEQEIILNENNIRDLENLTINIYKLIAEIELIEPVLECSSKETYKSLLKDIKNTYDQIGQNNIKIIPAKDYEKLGNYLNLELPKRIMVDSKNNSITIDDLILGAINTTTLFKTGLKNGAQAKNSVNFRLKLNKELYDNQITDTDSKILKKIYDCYSMAEYLKAEHSTGKIYNFIRKECISEYKSITNINSQNLLLQYVAPEFLKIKDK
jgi:hypothetical protein